VDVALAIGALTGKARVVDGRIVVERDGAIVFSTSGPYDDDPAISPDRRALAFVRRRPEIKDSYYFGEESERCDLWLVREGELPRRLVEGGPGDGGLFLEALSGPTFLSDSKLIIFRAPVATTSAGVFATDLTGRVHLVSDGDLIGEVSGGRWKGHLLVVQRRLDWKYPIGSPKYRGRIDRYAIVSRAGRELHELGDDAAKAFAAVKE
jgi:hypothetical protein